MAIQTQETLYLQALDHYHYDMEQCLEKLQYALSAGEDHPGIHYLLGRVYDERAQEYKKAKYHYEMALAIDHLFTPTYVYFAHFLVHLEDYDYALRVIDIGLTISGTDKAVLHYIKGVLYEKYEMFNTAKEHFKQSKLSALNSNFYNAMDIEIKRVKTKGKKKKTRKSKKK